LKKALGDKFEIKLLQGEEEQKFWQKELKGEEKKAKS
jgi:hypothetical protein